VFMHSYDWGFSISRIVASTNPTSSQILSTYDGKKTYVSLNAAGFNCIRVLTCDEDYVVEGLDIKPPLKDSMFLRMLSPFYYKSVITLPLI
jgi:hypothetical protein